MTLRRSGVDYTTHVWNPVTGCLHACRDQWCYAARDVKRYAPGPRTPTPGVSRVHLLDEPIRDEKSHRVPWPFGFEPTVHRYRLGDPLDQPAPARVFVSDYGDLFGSWVPTADIQAVLDVVARRPDLRFLLLTKNPLRYDQFALPPNAWAGTTYTGSADEHRIRALSGLHHAWLSWEPALGPLDPSLLLHADWVVIGGLTGRGARSPEPAWVEDVVGFCEEEGLPIFMKANIGTGWPGVPLRQFPEGLVVC